MIANFINVSDDKLSHAAEKFWKMDSSVQGSRSALSVEDRQVLKLWDNETERSLNHYVLPIPVREGVRLPNNKSVALSRLQNQMKRLEKDPALYKRYHDGIQELIDSGYAEKVTSSGQEGKVWYIPHHNVFNKAKPEKFRIVFDCAAQYAGTSLNKEVKQGPDLTNTLVCLLYTSDAADE